MIVFCHIVFVFFSQTALTTFSSSSLSTKNICVLLDTHSFVSAWIGYELAVALHSKNTRHNNENSSTLFARTTLRCKDGAVWPRRILELVDGHQKKILNPQVKPPATIAQPTSEDMTNIIDQFVANKEQRYLELPRGLAPFTR